MIRRTHVVTAVLCAALLVAARAAASQPLLLTKPTVSRKHLVFTYAGDLWIVERSGGYGRRLTSNPGTETDARFSPDGTQIAYTGLVDGNADVYVVAAGGGVPRRLTWHPGVDRVAGDLPAVQPRLVHVGGMLRSPSLSPTGARAALVLPSRWHGQARRQAHLGRTHRHLELPPSARRWMGDRPARRDLRTQRRLGSRERRNRA